MRVCMMLMAFVIVLSGCSHMKKNPFAGQVIIEWVDFVNIGSNHYTGLHEVIISDPELITNDVVGEVKFKVADAVTNTYYKTKAGDAAFLEKGTKLYRVVGFDADQLIATQDKNKIGGYRLFVNREYAGNIAVHYNDIVKNNIERIELYRNGETTKLIYTLTGDEKERFIELLESGEEAPNYNPNRENGDPTYYRMIFYNNGPLAYSYMIMDDQKNVYFHPWDTRIVDVEIRNWFK